MAVTPGALIPKRTTGRARSPSARWFAAVCAAAVVVALAASVNAYLAAAVLGLAGLVALTMWGAQPVLVLMVVAIFFELIQFGGATLARLVAPIGLLAVVFEVARRGSGLRWNALLVCVSAYGTWALASGMWTVDTGATVYLLQSLAIALVFMLAFAILPRSGDQLQKTLVVLAASSAVVAASAVAGFAGRQFLLPIELEEGRASGGATDPNFFANVQLVAFPIVVVLAFSAKRRSQRLALLLCSQLILASVMTSLSRGGFLAAIAQIVVLIVMPGRSLFESRRDKRLVILALLLAFTFLMTRETLRADVTRRFESIFHDDNSDAGSSKGSGREGIWAGARLSISERPVLGLGFGGFAPSSNQLILRTPDVDLTNFVLREHGSEVHNVYLSTTAELGYPGLVLFLGMLGSMTGLNLRTSKRAAAAGAPMLGNLASALIVSTVGWAASSFFISTETSRPLWFLIGLSLALAKLTSVYEVSNAPRSARAP